MKQPAIFFVNHTFRSLLAMTLLMASLISSGYAYAEDRISVENAWVRPTISGQDVGAAYMTFKSQRDVTLIRATSDATESVEIHSMAMQNGVMKMRMLENLPIQAGKAYELKPGGFHLMLFDLKKPLSAGQFVTFELTFKSGSSEFKQSVKAPVKAAPESSEHDHGHHHH